MTPIKPTWRRGLIYLAIVLTILSCSLPFNLMGDGDEAISTEPEIAAIPDTQTPPTDPSNDMVLPTATMTEMPAPTATIPEESDPMDDNGDESQPDVTPLRSTPTADPGVLPTPTTQTQDDQSQSVNPMDNAIMVFVPAGEFLMGYEGGSAEEDEGPEHIVYLDEYWLYQTPVTSNQYRQCILAGGCTGTLSRFPEDTTPVVRIDWQQASDYCEWAGGRLPTEAEWEKGARGTDGRLYPWGDQAPTCLLANFQGCFNNQITPVGQFPDGASPYGALDMLGTVWEWVSDWYDEDYYQTSDGENPTGPFNGTFRVQRGHSFESNLVYLRITDRGRSDPNSTDYRKGFRCVLPELP